MRVVVRVAIGQAAAMFRQIGRELHGTGKVTNMGDGDGGYCGYVARVARGGGTLGECLGRLFENSQKVQIKRPN